MRGKEKLTALLLCCALLLCGCTVTVRISQSGVEIDRDPAEKDQSGETSAAAPGALFGPEDEVFVWCEGRVAGTEEEYAEISLAEQERKELARIKESLSVVKDGRIAAETDGIHAMHDITEGGVLGAVCEMCEASGTGARIDLSAVPVLPLTSRVCTKYGLDVYGLISSGSMMIAARNGNRIVEAMRANGIPATVIGKAGGQGVYDLSSGQKRAITPYPADELYKVLER